MTYERVRDISEFDLIRRLEATLPATVRNPPSVQIGIGDDAAVVSISPGQQIVVTTDTLNEGVHFRLDWTDWTSLGYKALAVNLSDLAAMGATPVLATIALSLTGDELVTDLVDCYRGVGRCASFGQIAIAGGDITRTPGACSITITAIGETRHNRVLRRSSAAVGDLIWVTGTLGAAAAGLALLQMPANDRRRAATAADILRNALHQPVPRIGAGRTLAALGVHCAMDLSDGLSADLGKILAASHVDAEINLFDIPVSGAVHALFRDQALGLALNGGEDYELLFTAPDWMSTQIMEGLELNGVRGTIIGHITPRAGDAPRIVGNERHGSRSVVRPGGFDHFQPG